MADKTTRKSLYTFKNECAQELGITNYEVVDKGNLTSRENGSIGGQMVKHMVEAYESKLGR